MLGKKVAQGVWGQEIPGGAAVSDRLSILIQGRQIVIRVCVIPRHWVERVFCTPPSPSHLLSVLPSWGQPGPLTQGRLRGLLIRLWFWLSLLRWYSLPPCCSQSETPATSQVGPAWPWTLEVNKLLVNFAFFFCYCLFSSWFPFSLLLAERHDSTTSFH